MLIHRYLRIAALIGVLLIGSRWGWAQSSNPALEKELAQLGAGADELDKALPSFTCTETGTSQATRGRKVIRDVKFSATLRAHRVNDTGAHNETFTITELNGQPYTGAYAFPLYVSGGFDKGMLYFAPRLQACYTYALLPGRIDFATSPDVDQHPQCRNEKLEGFALLDKNGNVTHLERRVPAEIANQSRLAPFTSIDFAPVELNGQTFRLAQHMISEHTYEHTRARFDVTYSECKLFHVTVTIDPLADGATVQPGGNGNQPD